jgi:hypothetical protein
MSRSCEISAHFKEVIILTYNEKFKCWDDEEGDDFYCDFSNVDFWRPLPYYRSCD